MNTFLKTLKYASIISFVLLTIRISVSFVDIFSRTAIGLHDIPFSYITIFTTCFFTIFFFKKESIKNIILSLFKAIIISSITINVFTVTTLRFISNAPLKLFNTNLFISLIYDSIGNIMTVIITALLYYIIQERFSKKRHVENTPLPIKNILYIYSIISALYITLIFIAYDLNTIFYKLTQTITLGFLASIVIYSVINYCKRENVSKNITIVYYSLAYLFNIAVISTIIHYTFNPLNPAEKGILGIIESFSRQDIDLSVINEYYLTITIAIHVYSIYFSNKQEKEKLKQIGVTASLKYQQLKAQLSPHFLFNNISVLTGLIEENQTKAITFSENLSNVYRYFLDQEKQDIVTLKEEMIFASKYLDLLKVRYENALIVNNIIIINSEDYYILPMALQQVFENVIKHNEISIEHNLTIDISNDKEYLTITNNINPKITQQASLQTGLENIINRYSFFTDKKVIVTKDAINYTIKLPLLKIEA